MIVDLHCHYPMHLTATWRKSPPGHHATPEDLVRGLAMTAANALMNAPMVVTVDSLRAGEVMVALSVLLEPFDEIDLGQHYGAPPQARYFDDLLRLMDAVEADIRTHHAGQAVVARNHAELEAADRVPQVALVHAVEGGFHLGATEDEVRANVRTLAGRGVAYITLAHLFFRQVATNAPAIPMLTDALYNRICPQPGGGLQPLGDVLVDEMVNQKILIDCTHMSRASFDATMHRLHAIDAQDRVPVIASHAACALTPEAEYNMTDDQILAVQRRGGVIGLIACEHWMSMGRRAPRNFEETMVLLGEHIQHIRDVTGTFDNIAIGSDMDGFIRPSLKGLDTPEDYNSVKYRLIDAFGQDAADAICFRNALRVLQWWRS